MERGVSWMNESAVRLEEQIYGNYAQMNRRI